MLNSRSWEHFRTIIPRSIDDALSHTPRKGKLLKLVN